jgi:hypothetical protein
VGVERQRHTRFSSENYLRCKTVAGSMVAAALLKVDLHAVH